MNPITIIRERIAESKRREGGIPAAPWFALDGEVMWDQDSLICDCWQPGDSQKDVENISGFIASARSDLPMWRSIAERAAEALEKAAHGPHCHLLKLNRPFGEKARIEWDAKGCDCWKNEVFTAIVQQLAEGGIE